LEKYSDTYQSTTFSARAQHWQESHNKNNQLLKAAPWASIKRIIENKLNDSFIWI
jgi:hypothetical protein